MNISKKLMVVLLSAFMFLGAAATPVSAKGLGGRGIGPTNSEAEPVLEEVPEEETEEAAPEEEETAEEIVAEEVPAEEEIPVEEVEAAEEETSELAPVADKEALIDEAELTALVEEVAAPMADATPALRDTPELTAPEASKTLEPNGDGTYTLSLSVTGQAKTGSEDEVHKANVILILDRSGSMNYSTEYTYDATTYSDAYDYYTGSWSGQTPGQGWGNSQVEFRNGAWYYANSNQRYADANTPVYCTRLVGAQMAINVLSKELLAKNTDYTDLIEVKCISFASYRGSAQTNTNTESAWISGTSNSTLMTAVNRSTTYGGTNWQAALEYGKAELDAKKAADGEEESYYAIFLTDGEPTFYGHGTSRTEGTDDGYRGNGGSYDSTGQSRANTAAKEIVDAGYNFYSIFTFGSGTEQQNYLRRTTNYAYGEGDISDGTHSGTNFFDAKSITDLMSAFQHMIDTITNNVAFGNVTFKDGLSTDVTASTLVAGQATGFKYTVSGKVGNLYTVTAEGNTVTFNVAGQDYPGEKKTSADGKEYWSATVNGTEYKMALANMDENGMIIWDLGAIGTLLDGYTYKVSFIVWPEQEAYDYVAGLNNGLDGYEWSDDAAIDSGKGYKTNGVEKYPSIVKYDNGVYAVLTNTEQSLTYYIMTTTVDADGTEHPSQEGPFPLELDSAEPMGLEGSSVAFEKVWEHGLAESELKELIFGKDGTTYTGYKVVLDVSEDGKDYMSFTFPKLNAAGQPVDADGNVTTDVNKLVWSDELAIAPGIMVSDAAAARSGLDVTGYEKVTMDGVTYSILPDANGHKYEIEEVEGQDLHFEFNTVIYHPMLVDGVLKNVEFNGSTAKLVGEDEELQSFKAFNTLKGGIDIYKTVGTTADFVKVENDTVTVDQTHVVDITDEFAFTVTLKDADGKPVGTPAADVGVSGALGYRIYEGEGDSRVTIARGDIPASGEITLVMQANQYAYIVNVPSGTQYTVTEIEDESEKPVYKYILTAGEVQEGDAAAKFVSSTTKNDYSGTVHGNTAEIVKFYNYSDEYFYVYHSKDNEVERVAFTDSRVKGTYDTEAKKYVYTFDIVAETKTNSLYGGYYSNYAGKSSGYDSTAVTTWDANNKYSDAQGKPYNYANIKDGVKWVYSEGYTVSGKRMNPAAGETYYLKEVPTGYLLPYTQYTYYKPTLNVANLYQVTAVDDLNYEALGFEVQTKNFDAKVYKTLKIRAKNGQGATTLKPETTFKAQGVLAGYLGYADISEFVKVSGDVTVNEYWDTKDGIRVFGIKTRTLKGQSNVKGFKKSDATTRKEPIEIN